MFSAGTVGSQATRPAALEVPTTLKKSRRFILAIVVSLLLVTGVTVFQLSSSKLSVCTVVFVN
jgi:hypothetical protein